MERSKFLLLVLFASSFISAKSLGLTLADRSVVIAIDTTEVISIGGISQVISIKGKDNTNPILLYLHGGPGESVMDKAEAFTSKLQSNFVVVQWDQRDTGKTLTLNASPEAPTVSLMKHDAKEVVDYLLKRFGQRKLYVVGHSWGTVLGFHIADKYPELVHAYIAISPLVDQTESDRMWLKKVIKFEKEKGNQKAVEELSAIQVPFENFDQMFTARKWLSDYEGKPVPDSMVTLYKKMLEPWKNKWFAVSSEVNRENLFKNIPSVKCPVYLFVGRTDYQTYFKITERYYNRLKAPKKKLYWFENSGHLIPSSEPDRMQEIIIEEILPERF